MQINQFLEKLANSPLSISFQDTMSVVSENYSFTPTAFTNGDTKNEAGQNNGSCQLFAFAKLHGLTEHQTLHCFGSYYHDDVLKHPEGENHQNIRNFMKHGWAGISFNGEALVPK